MTFPSNWEVVPLESCLSALIDYRGKTPAKTLSGIPLVTAKIVKAGRIEQPTEFIAKEDYNAWMTRGYPEPGDVVITTEAPLGEVAQLGTDTVALAQRIILLRGKINQLDNSFLKYSLMSEYLQSQLRSRSSGTTVVGIKQSELRKIEIAVPPFAEQRNIAKSLSALDNKIELNRNMNTTLEQIAQALFKSWFVDFDPVKAKAAGRPPEGMDTETAALFPSEFQESELGLIPKGWRVGKIGEIANVIDCLHSKKPERKEIGLPLLQLWNIRGDGLLDMEDTYFISEDSYRLWISRIEAAKGDCVITNVGRVGAVAQIADELKAALGRNMTALRCKPTFSFPTFLLQSLISDVMKTEIFIKKDTGTILDALNVKNIPTLRLVVPALPIADLFEQIARPVRAKMEKNVEQSRTLITLRNSLLPKLISGQLRIPDVAESEGNRV